MAIIGAGFAGPSAALYLGDAPGAEHEITVIDRLKDLSYVPSWVWAGNGRMPVEMTVSPLEPVNEKSGTRFVHGRAWQVAWTNGPSWSSGTAAARRCSTTTTF